MRSIGFSGQGRFRVYQTRSRPACLVRVFPFTSTAMGKRYRLGIALDASGRLHQGAGEITETPLAQAQAALRSLTSDIENNRGAAAAVALPLFRPMNMNHHAFTLAPRICFDEFRRTQVTTILSD